MATTLGQYKGVNINAGSDAEIQAQMKAIDAGAPVSVSSLGKNVANTDNFPNSSNSPISYDSAVKGAIASATTPTTDPYADVKDMISKSSSQSTNWTDTYKTLLADTGFTDTQKQVNDLTAQLNAITASSQSDQLALEGQDVRRTSTVLNKLKSEISRQNAIKALPITASLNAAQGRLDTAKENINTLMTLMQKDEESKLQLEQNKINYAMKFADVAQQKLLQQRQEELDKAKTETANFNSLRQTYIDKALAVGDFATAGKMASATDKETLTTLAGSISNKNDLDAQLKKAQIAKLQMEISGGGTNANQLLSISDAKALGVPYGTTVGQAIKMGVTPGQGGTGVLQLASTKNNIDSVTSLLSDKNLSSSVGPNSLSRTSFTNWFTGGKSNFIAGVEQMRSQLNLETLINAKAQGATFGALSDNELKMLASAASKIGSWAVKDSNGNIIGYNASEKDFKAELDKINNFAKLDYLLKGGNMEDVGAQQLEDGTVWVKNADGSFTQLR